MHKFDLAVIGSGPGGYVCAIKAAHAGLKTVIFEKEYIGGVCLNVGCIPTKAMIKSAHLYHEILNAKNFGIGIASYEGIAPDFAGIMARKDGIVSRLTSGVNQLLKSAGVTVVTEFAQMLDYNLISAGGEEYEVKNTILALGSRPSFPNIPGMAEAVEKGDVVDSTGILSLKELPKSLLVIGGGVIALEFATIYNALGTEVTMIQRSAEILSGMDMEIRKLMGRVAKRAGINLRTNTKLVKLEGKKLTYEEKGKEKEVEAECVLVSLGRDANIKGAEELGLEMERGRPKVSEYYQTSVPNVYAIGDMSSKLSLAHVATAEGLCALDHILGKPRTIDYKKIPAGVYGFPEAAAIGYTEDELKEEGREYAVSKFPVSACGKAMASGETQGFVKIISTADKSKILGVHIVSSVANDLISEALMIMELGGSVEDIARAVHPHPTNSEMFMEAAHDLEGYPIHTIKK